MKAFEGERAHKDVPSEFHKMMRKHVRNPAEIFDHCYRHDLSAPQQPQAEGGARRPKRNALHLISLVGGLTGNFLDGTLALDDLGKTERDTIAGLLDAPPNAVDDHPLAEDHHQGLNPSQADAVADIAFEWGNLHHRMGLLEEPEDASDDSEGDSSGEGEEVE